MIEKASEANLIALRDRCGLLTPKQAWEVLQRLTWIGQTPVHVTLMNRAIDDVEQNEPHRDETYPSPDSEIWKVRTELVDVKSDLPPGAYDGVVVGVDSSIQDDHGVMTLRYALGDIDLPEPPIECNGANDGTCPKHPEINVPLTVIPNSATL